MDDLAILDDRLYVVSYTHQRVHVLDLDGLPQSIISLDVPTWTVALDAAGRLFGANSDENGEDVQISIFNATGVEQVAFGEWGSGPGELAEVGNLWFDTDGSLLVADGTTGIMRFTQTAGRTARRNDRNGGDSKRAQAKQKQKGRKRNDRDKRGKGRKQRNAARRERNDGRGKGNAG